MALKPVGFILFLLRRSWTRCLLQNLPALLLIDKTAVGQAVLTHLKEHRYKQGVNKKIAPKCKKVNISPGRSISFEEVSNKDLAPENSSGTLSVPAKKI